MRSIISGVILIAIGFANGDSIFLGRFDLFSIGFDALGLFWIGRGIHRIWRLRQPQS